MQWAHEKPSVWFDKKLFFPIWHQKKKEKAKYHTNYGLFEVSNGI